jgi:hypothetical protein
MFILSLMMDQQDRNILTQYQSFFILPTDAQVNYLKNNIKIYIRTATCFGAVTIIMERIIRAC